MHVASDTQNIQSSDWSKWHCALWHNVISHFCWIKHHFRWSNKLVVNTSIIPLLHYDHESHESPRIDNFLDLWLNRYEFLKFLPFSYIFVVSSDQSGICGKIPEWVKNIYECLRIDHDSVTMAKNALQINNDFLESGVRSIWLEI